MFCTVCGNELPEGAKFCSECGARVETEHPAARREAVTRGEQNVPVLDKIDAPIKDLDFGIQWEDDENTRLGTKAQAQDKRVSFDWSSVIDESHKKSIKDVRSPWDSTGIDDSEMDMLTKAIESDRAPKEETLEQEIFREAGESVVPERSRTLTFIDILKKEREEKDKAAEQEFVFDHKAADIDAPFGRPDIEFGDSILPEEEREYTKGYTDLRSDIISEMEKEENAPTIIEPAEDYKEEAVIEQENPLEHTPDFEEQLAYIRARRSAQASAIKQEASAEPEPEDFYLDISESPDEPPFEYRVDRQESNFDDTVILSQDEEDKISDYEEFEIFDDNEIDLDEELEIPVAEAEAPMEEAAIEQEDEEEAPTEEAEADEFKLDLEPATDMDNTKSLEEELAAILGLNSAFADSFEPIAETSEETESVEELEAAEETEAAEEPEVLDIEESEQEFTLPGSEDDFADFPIESPTLEFGVPSEDSTEDEAIEIPVDYEEASEDTDETEEIIADFTDELSTEKSDEELEEELEDDSDEEDESEELYESEDNVEEGVSLDELIEDGSVEIEDAYLNYEPKRRTARLDAITDEMIAEDLLEAAEDIKDDFEIDDFEGKLADDFDKEIEPEEADIFEKDPLQELFEAAESEASVAMDQTKLEDFDDFDLDSLIGKPHAIDLDFTEESVEIPREWAEKYANVLAGEEADEPDIADKMVGDPENRAVADADPSVETEAVYEAHEELAPEAEVADEAHEELVPEAEVIEETVSDHDVKPKIMTAEEAANEIAALQARIAELMGQKEEEPIEIPRPEAPSVEDLFEETITEEEPVEEIAAPEEANPEQAEKQPLGEQETESVEKPVEEKEKPLSIDEELLALGFEVDEVPEQPTEASMLFTEETTKSTAPTAHKGEKEVIGEEPVMTIDELEKDLFGAGVDEDAEATRKIEKFFTLYKKNEEFQKLLDAEYDKLKSGDDYTRMLDVVNEYDKNEEKDYSTQVMGPITTETIRAGIEKDRLSATAQLKEAEKIGAVAKAAADTDNPAAAAVKAVVDKIAEEPDAEKKAPVVLPEEVVPQKEKEKKEEVKEGGKVLTVLAVIVAILLALLLVAILVLNFARDSALGVWISNMIGQFTSMGALPDVTEWLL